MNISSWFNRGKKAEMKLLRFREANDPECFLKEFLFCVKRLSKQQALDFSKMIAEDIFTKGQFIRNSAVHKLLPIIINESKIFSEIIASRCVNPDGSFIIRGYCEIDLIIKPLYTYRPKIVLNLKNEGRLNEDEYKRFLSQPRKSFWAD